MRNIRDQWNEIEFHADDYGLFPAQSRRILECCEKGVLNGISIMPNSPCLAECMDMLGEYRDRLYITAHLNLMEGKSTDASAEVRSLLTDEEGNFNVGFGKYLVVSCLPGVRGKYKAALVRELRAQIRSTLPYMKKRTNGAPEIRLDGHGHYHMLPVVFDALMEVVGEDGLEVSFVRLPAERTWIYFANKKKISDFTLINLVKVAVLNTLVRRNVRKYRSFFAPMQSQLFSGVMLSGHMQYVNVRAILEDMCRIARTEGRRMEILFHPGSVLEDQDIEALTNKDDKAFLTSEWRAKEAAALMELINDRP